MDELTIFNVWATWTNVFDEPHTTDAAMVATADEATKRYNRLLDHLKTRQRDGVVKHFTMHIEVQYLEQSKEV